MEKLPLFVNGVFFDSASDKDMEIYDPSIGNVIARAPCCTQEEVDAAIRAAANAFPGWAATPVMQRVQVLYRVRALLEEHLDELTQMVCRENGKSWGDARGDVLKAKEGTEQAICAPNLMLGDVLMNASNAVDSMLFREPLGVFAGIVPWNFPAMIPMGWMAPMCLATGNTMVIKASSITPMTCLRIARLYQEAGLPAGVLNIVTCSRNEAELFLSHRMIKGISFVGSTAIGAHIYATASANSKRVQALCEAKNHAFVLEDALIDRTAVGIINSAFGCAGERCMALAVVVAQDKIADQLVCALVQKARALKIGPGYDRNSEIGPLVTSGHKKFVVDWIKTGERQGAQVILDGRDCIVPGYEDGFYVGPTILDNVTEKMTVGTQEIFGPVLCVKRVKTFEEGVGLINANPFANGSVIFTQNGYYARRFVNETHAGMVGVNVGIPVPIGVFPFSGHKKSFLGDLHVLGKDGPRFYTQAKCVTVRWFDDEEAKRERVDSWDGTI
jgi:malonate-semialdehyde dehydrogenase (acetylating)/methylmalonate-semialdehyde dehydrogenase